MLEVRTCGTCLSPKPMSEFHKDKTNVGGHKYRCKSCRKDMPDPPSPYNPDRPRDRNISRARNRDDQERLRADVLSILGGKCCKCGFSDRRALQVDHPNGGGSKHIKAVSWRTRYIYIIEYPWDFQLLCANCNWIKRSVEKEACGRPRIY